ncbi:tetratricopeptide repeat protein [Streptomyces longwoodensis]|uniref:tetratricopeptide repeat protein n=1 Tax=Streptomyces longwoodensis TaxID=68231 RepID=UPI00224DE831|nr:tetratricopeptide repeat protein [Streptomyces longwoodensis]MCX4995290.1 tetratricopeptide repeat protein [Streptomyces longwoodensis]WRY90063.1 tetratricopeptide repeat protein [Streptomyces longwoodensis]WTI45626.1 tetratricopeptide repeat protein [Streptomyces longwoodensis]
MSRLSREKTNREKKRDQKLAAGSPTAGVVPLDVRVGGTGPGGAGATIGGVPVAAADGEEAQHAVLRHLHRIALATGHPVLATVHDTRIGYVVPLRVDTDGSSHFTGEPTRMAPLGEAAAPVPTPTPERAPAPLPTSAPGPASETPTAPGPAPVSGHPAASEHPVASEHSAAPQEPPSSEPARDKPTHLLRSVSEPVQDAAPTFRLRAVPEPQDAAPAPGTVAPPTGVFGPPPAMDPSPEHATAVPTDPARPPAPAAPASPATRDLGLELGPALAEADPEPKHTPARGFDAVAEAVLGEDPRTATGTDGTPAVLAEPTARINEAVRAGRIDAAAQLAERTVAEASGTLGPAHPEVLTLRELGAYIAYLSGDALRAFHVSLELAGIHRRAGDAEAAYGNVQSAAAAWRAVRDPLQGLNLGTELIGLWTELAAEDGPAAEDPEELESARARMLRLAQRARTAGA